MARIRLHRVLRTKHIIIIIIINIIIIIIIKVSTQQCFNSPGDWLAQDSFQLVTPMGGIWGAWANTHVARKPETPEEATKERLKKLMA